MMDQLTALGLGIVTLSIIVGVGTVVLSRFGGATANCGSLASLPNGAYNYTLDKCANSSGATANPTNTGWVSTNYLEGQLGSSGLAGWVPAVIAVAVGLLFLGAFLIGKGRGKGRY